MQFVQTTKVYLLPLPPARNRGRSSLRCLFWPPLNLKSSLYLLPDHKYLPFSNLSLLHTVFILLFPPGPVLCLHFWISIEGMATSPPPLGTGTMGRISPAPVMGWEVVAGAHGGSGRSVFLKHCQAGSFLGSASIGSRDHLVLQGHLIPHWTVSKTLLLALPLSR